MLSKILCVGDLHFGVKEGVQKFIEYQHKEFDKIVDYVKENDIKNVFFLGDIFNNRRMINIITLNHIKRKFKELDKLNVDIYILNGNHDSYYKDTNIINSPLIVFDNNEFPNIKIIYKEPEEITIDGKLILCVPWITKDNYDVCIDYIKNSSANICLGHFEISGFLMNSFVKCKEGFKPSQFKRFKRVFSGHFHTKSSDKNIKYLGSNTQMTWNDFNDSKGFHIYDLGTDEIDFIESDVQIFKKIIISEKTDLKQYEDVKDSFLRIYINKKLKPKENKVLTNIISNNISYEIIDNTILDDDNKSIAVIEEDFKDMLKEGIEIKNDIDKSIKSKCFDLIMKTRNKILLEG